MGYYDDEDDLARTAQEQAASGTQWDPNVRAHMMKMLTGGGDSEGLTRARADADSKRSRAGVMQGIATMFGGAGKVNNGFYDGLRSNAGQGVKDAQMADATRQKITQYLIEKDDGLRALSAKGDAAKAAQTAAIDAKTDQRSWQEGENEKSRQAAAAASALRREDQQINARQREDDRAETRHARNEDRAAETAVKTDEKMEQLRIGDFGYAQTTEDAKQLKSGVESKASFDNRLDELISLREKHSGGAILNREDVGRAKQLSKDLLLQYKDMAKLGVLSKADEDILNAIIPDDPLQYNSPLSAIQGQDPTLHKLKKFKEDAGKDFDTKLRGRLRGKGNNMPAAAAPSGPMRAKDLP